MKNIGKARKQVHLPIPAWVAVVYGLFCIVMVPWTVYLSVTLRSHAIVEHWAASWVGLDIGLVVLLLATAIFGYRKSKWVVLASIMTGSFLLVDAWFDITTARGSLHLAESLLLALFVEIPVSLMSFSIGVHVLSKNVK